MVACIAASGVIIDRIAIVVGDRIIKDSDIRRDIRVTSFLNGQPLDFSLAARKRAASRLIDQTIIRNEVQLGNYPRPTSEEVDKQLAAIEKQRFKTEAAWQQALKKYGLSEADLRTQFRWQLTVLRFIEVRFKPAVFISDEQIQTYYNEHNPALARAHPGHSSLSDLQDEIRDTLTEEEVNRQFFAWLDQQRKDIKIQFLEEDLQ